jgi:preprotein translocase subunit SecE
MNTLSVIAAITANSLLTLVVNVVVAGLIFWLLWWLIHYIPVPQPFLKVLEVIIAVCAVVWLINILMGLTGNAFIVIG